jgi:hypothetical protein
MLFLHMNAISGRLMGQPLGGGLSPTMVHPRLSALRAPTNDFDMRWHASNDGENSWMFMYRRGYQ